MKTFLGIIIGLILFITVFFIGLIFKNLKD